MILPSVLAMDRTQVDTFGWLQMEPINISHGLLKHSARSKPSAMRILGYINHSAAHKLLPEASKERTPENLPKGTVIAPAPLETLSNVLSWPTYLLNEMHIQIKFILKESGFKRLQQKGLYWKLHYAGKTFPINKNNLIIGFSPCADHTGCTVYPTPASYAREDYDVLPVVMHP
jgi:hypothetical protein